jgi:hypothetical protein
MLPWSYRDGAFDKVLTSTLISEKGPTPGGIPEWCPLRSFQVPSGQGMGRVGIEPTTYGL